MVDACVTGVYFSATPLGANAGTLGVVHGVFDHLCPDPLAEHLDVDAAPQLRVVGGEVGEGDGPSHAVALVAAGDPADDVAVDPDGLGAAV